MRDELASRAIEQKLLSYLLEYDNSQDEYMPKLSPSDFHYFKQTYQQFDKLYTEEELNSATAYTRCDESAINDIMRTNVSPSEIESLYDNLKDLANRRRLLGFTKQVEGAIQSDEAIREQIVDLESELVELTENFYTADSIVSVSDLIPSLEDHLEELRNSEGLTGVPTGLNDLNSQTAGFQDGDYILIAARTSVGKTDLMLNSALASVKHSEQTTVFSLEMSSTNLLKRLASMVSGVHRQKVRRGTYNDHEKKRIKSALDTLGRMPFYIDEKSHKVDEIVYKIQRQVKRDKLDIAFIDYFGLIGAPNVDNGTVQNEKAECSHKLKFLAKKVDIPIVVLAQLNRRVEYRESGDPRISDLRGTGALEQDADTTLLIDRPALHDEDVDSLGKTIIKIGKQRNGPTGTIDAHYDTDTGLFKDA